MLKKNVSKVISTALVLVLSMALLSGCGQTPSAPAETSDAEVSDTAGDTAAADDASGKKYKVALICKTLTNPFFITMDEGAKAKAEELGIEYICQAPEKETDAEKQMQIMENLILQDVDAIVLVPSGSQELIPAIKKANDKNIPVLIVDTKVDEDALAAAGAHVETFIGSDNFLGGQLAAEEVAKALGEKGEVAVLEGVAGHESNESRIGGFKDKMGEYGDMTIVASQPANWEMELGYTVFQNMLQANPNIKGVFGANDMMALGAVKAIEDAGKTGEIVVIGFDAVDDAKTAMKDGKMVGTVAQYPDKMGEVGIQSAFDLLNGSEIEPEIGVEVKVLQEEDL